MNPPEKVEIKKTPYKDVNTRCFQESFSVLINHYKKIKLAKK